jgi:hypothetical protein
MRSLFPLSQFIRENAMKRPTIVRLIQNESETVLRIAPDIDDKYDDSASRLEDRAVFGNVIAKYVGGAKGRVLFSQKDKDRRLWGYVVLSPESNILRYHIGYPVNAGWVLLNGERTTSN